MSKYLFSFMCILLLTQYKCIAQNAHMANINVNQQSCSYAGIASLEIQNVAFSANPNPAQDFINIEILNYHNSYKLIISDIFGKEISIKKFSAREIFVPIILILVIYQQLFKKYL